MDISRPPVKRQRYRSPVLVPTALQAEAAHKKKVKLPRGFVNRFACLGFSLLMLVSLFTAITPSQGSDRYALSPETKSLIGATDPELTKKLTFDPAKQIYQYNSQGEGGAGASPAAGIPDMSLKASAGAENFGLDMPKDPAKGLTTHDLKNDISIKMVPMFKLRQGGQSDDNRIVYPLATGGQLIYSIKGNGIKEDIVLMDKTADTLSFSYRLELPKTLEARLLDNGDIGIFGGDASLFGNISYGSDEDRAKVELAREKSAKNNLLFAIPAPVIVESSPSTVPPEASFELTDNVLTVKAKGLQKANYPLSIDPSIVVTSASDFTKGNQEGNIEFDAANNQIKRGGLTGGTVPSWTATSNLSYARVWSSSAVYNGFIYVIGGDAGVCNCSVEYAPINTNGTVGAWSVTSSFTSMTESGVAVYNGYLYVLGGFSGAVSNVVQYAPINPNGSLGIWGTTTSFNTARYQLKSIAYNGYMYVTGGCSAVNILACATIENSTQYAPINANGTLGPWTASTNFITPRLAHTQVAYNGYMYILGGYSGSYNNSVEYAAINANGSLGTWATTSSFTNGRYYHVSIADGGYMYVIGGSDSGGIFLADVQYAPIRADGTLGSWAATTSFSTGRNGFGGVAYKGHLYFSGGCSAVAGVTCSSMHLDTQYAKIDPAGVTSGYTATTSFTTARTGHTSVAYNGYLYILGGCSAFGIGCATPHNDVQYAPINTDGTVGTWAATTAFATARYYHTSLVHGGYMYVLGGDGGGSTRNDVQYAPINTDGTVGAWTATSTFTTARQEHSSAIYAGYMYVLGGTDGTTFNDVQYAPINANGTVGAWNTTTAFSNVRRKHTSVAHGGYLYVIGGVGAIQYNDVQYAPLGANGTVGTWNTTNSFTTTRQGHTTVVHNGYMYILGGVNNSGAKLNDVQYAVINNNGTVGTWNTTASFTTPRLEHTTVVYNGNIYIAGGTNQASLYNDVQYAQINNGGNGKLSSWTATTVFNGLKNDHTSVAHNGYMYVMGGSNTSDIQYAPINADGTIGTWTFTTGFPTVRTYHTAHAYNGYMYVLGGEGNPADTSYAPINSNGTLGSWTSTNSFTNGRIFHTSVIYSGYIYVLGGGTGSIMYNDVQYAPVNANGTIGTWAATTNLPAAVWGQAGFVVNGYVYVAGGCGVYGLLGACSTFTKDVYYAQLNSNGTIGSWTKTTSLPLGLYNHRTVVANGYAYLTGGFKEGIGQTNEVFYAPINANGTIGGWTAGTVLTSARFSHASIYYNGRIYTIGGCTVAGVGCNGNTNEVTYAAPEAIPRVARYSQMFDTAGDSTATKFYYRGAVSGGSRMGISYKAANTSTGVFGTPTSVFDLASNTLKPYSISESRYYQMTFTIDDSQSAVFPDVSGTPASMSDFEIFFHPAPAKRLRGGKTFTNEIQRSLDAQP